MTNQKIGQGKPQDGPRKPITRAKMNPRWQELQIYGTEAIRR